MPDFRHRTEGEDTPPPREETAGDALWALSEDFEAKGDHAAAHRTLEFLEAAKRHGKPVLIAECSASRSPLNPGPAT